MLKNLIKYEFKATGRTLGLLYAALIIIACVSRLILGLNNFNDGMGGSAFPFVGIISLRGSRHHLHRDFTPLL